MTTPAFPLTAPAERSEVFERVANLLTWAYNSRTIRDMWTGGMDDFSTTGTLLQDLSIGIGQDFRGQPCLVLHNAAVARALVAAPEVTPSWHATYDLDVEEIACLIDEERQNERAEHQAYMIRRAHVLVDGAWAYQDSACNIWQAVECNEDEVTLTLECIQGAQEGNINCFSLGMILDGPSAEIIVWKRVTTQFILE